LDHNVLQSPDAKSAYRSHRSDVALLRRKSAVTSSLWTAD